MAEDKHWRNDENYNYDEYHKRVYDALAAWGRRPNLVWA